MVLRPDGPGRNGTRSKQETWPLLTRPSLWFWKILKNSLNKELDKSWRQRKTKNNCFSWNRWAIGFTFNRHLSGEVSVWGLTRKTARTPALLSFSIRQINPLLRLGEKAFDAYSKRDWIMDMYHVLRARKEKERPLRQSWPVAWPHFLLKWSAWGCQVNSSSITTPKSYENESHFGRSNGLWEESSRNLCNEVKVEAESAKSHTVEVTAASFTRRDTWLHALCL